jgi:phenylpyruvate tautomerase PptA (4-oxalocrotonate tautomerase family)
MPLVKISRRSGRPAEENRQVGNAVHDALVEAFKIPDHDRLHVWVELDAGHLETPAERGPAFTLIEIVAFPGRSAEAKRTLFRGIAGRLQELGIPGSDLFVILTEPPLESWSVRNGVSAADVKPGFKLDV